MSLFNAQSILNQGPTTFTVPIQHIEFYLEETMVQTKKAYKLTFKTQDECGELITYSDTNVIAGVLLNSDLDEFCVKVEEYKGSFYNSFIIFYDKNDGQVFIDEYIEPIVMMIKVSGESHAFFEVIL
jgi:hypothetical protein